MPRNTSPQTIELTPAQAVRIEETLEAHHIGILEEMERAHKQSIRRIDVLTKRRKKQLKDACPELPSELIDYLLQGVVTITCKQESDKMDAVVQAVKEKRGRRVDA